MKEHRFIGDFDFSQQECVVTDPDIVHQWRRVLRMKPGDEVTLLNGKGAIAQAVMKDMDNGRAVVTIRHTEEASGVQQPVVLYCAILKRENMEVVVQKATEVGISRIVPLVTKRTVKLGFRIDRMERIAKEAAEQCGRLDVPSIAEPLSLDEALETAQHDRIIFFDLHAPLLTSAMVSLTSKGLGVCIGPEGGWDESERTQARAAGCTFASLGNLVLRAETAALIASYCAVHGAVPGQDTYA
ncbi:MAG TPA: RsmE family RNA methyltransferase [Candidatus Kapabacteria bacterium]|nr:RsmE family RNA methyltransferase [Candidatus Kapabacteria bacterium]